MRHIVSIAGTDSYGCSGLHQDLRASLAQDVHCFSVVTAVTAQNHESLDALQPISSEIMLAQWHAIVKSHRPEAVKIGMLTDLEAMMPLLQKIKDMDIPVVVDPILMTSSQMQTLPASNREIFLKHVLPLASIATPNIPELEWILGDKVTCREDMRNAAQKILALGCTSVLIKGGHSHEEDATDYYCDASGGIWLSSSRLPQKFRGTGCYLSTAIACALARGLSLRDAVIEGKSHLLRSFADSYELDDRHVLKEVKPLETQAHISYSQNTDAEQRPSFPNLGSDPIGFYPIFPRSHWLKRLAPLGIKTAQIRIKDLEGPALVKELEESIAICKKYDCRLFINDYWQLAIELGAYGVHLGQEDIAEADIKAIHARGLRLGISTHSLEELSYGLSFKPSYVALGPIFPTTCKSMAFGPHGIDAAKRWVQVSAVPVVAIGGLKPEHVAPLKKTGVQGMALISDITENPDPEGRVKTWLDLMAIEAE